MIHVEGLVNMPSGIFSDSIIDREFLTSFSLRTRLHTINAKNWNEFLYLCGLPKERG